jgi:peptidoglycan pentaglycine glycine transferase (the first glycine)
MCAGPRQTCPTLEARCVERHDGLWGVYRFKRGFGGRVARFAGAFDRVYNPLMYRLYRLALKYRNIAP